MRLLALPLALAVAAACTRAEPRQPDDPLAARPSAVTSDGGPPDAVAPAIAAPTIDPALAAWQGTWVVPDYASLSWSILEVQGDAVRVTSSRLNVPGAHPGKLTVVAPCMLSVKTSSPVPHATENSTFTIPFVFDGPTLHAGIDVALRRGPQILGCGSNVYTLEGGTCQTHDYLGQPASVSCQLDGDLFSAGDDLVVPMHGDAGWTDRPPAVRAATLAEARQLYDEKAAVRFDFTGAGIPVGFAGIKLGDRHVGPITARFGPFAGADAQLLVRSDVRGVVDEIDLLLGTDTASITALLGKRFGPARGDRWVGTSSQIIATEPRDNFSGMANVTIAILPLGETHTCGRQDGFSKFYREFERAVGAKRWTAVAAMMKLPQKDWDDIEGPEVATHLRTAAELAAAPGEVFGHGLLTMIPASKGQPSCDLVSRQYVIRYGSDRLSPAVYATRSPDGRWQITSVGNAPHDLF